MQRVLFQTTNSATTFTDKERKVVENSVKTLSWTEDVVKSLSCVSVGGYPPPSVAIQLDSEDITARFSLSYSATLHGIRGLRVITYTSERYAKAHNLTRPAKTIQKLTLALAGGALRVLGVHLHIFPINYALKIFFHRPGGAGAPLHPLATPMTLETGVK